MLARFAELYAVEKEARPLGLGVEQRQALRQKKSVAIMAALKERLVGIRQQISPAGALAKACDYALEQWDRREVFLNDGRVKIDVSVRPRPSG